jgi:hypothetical protein
VDFCLESLTNGKGTSGYVIPYRTNSKRRKKMKSAVNDLVSMRDVEGLFEIMNESEDWMDQMDAAEGLVSLGDWRGLDYLLIARQSDVEEITETAREILSTPEAIRMRDEIEAGKRFDSIKLVESARERLKKGKKVFLHKVIRLSAADFVRDDTTDPEIQIYDLNDAGLEGWEVVNVLPQRQMVGPGERNANGAYVFLRKELAPDEGGELESK